MTALTRRTALALTGSSVTSALAGLAVGVAQASSELPVIAAHRAAIGLADVEWSKLSEVIDANPDVDEMPVHVQYGRMMLIERNDDGTDKFRPLYAYDDISIDEAVDSHLRPELSMWGHGPNGEKRMAEIRERAEARRARLKAELHRLQAKKKAAEDACGITARHETAKAASTVVDARLADLLAYACRDVSEVAAIAAYLVECDEDGVEGIETDTAFVAWVRHLAEKAVQA